MELKGSYPERGDGECIPLAKSIAALGRYVTVYRYCDCRNNILSKRLNGSERPGALFSAKTGTIRRNRPLRVKTKRLQTPWPQSKRALLSDCCGKRHGGELARHLSVGN